MSTTAPPDLPAPEAPPAAAPDREVVRIGAPARHHSGSPWANAAVRDTAIALYVAGQSASLVCAALWQRYRVRVSQDAVIGLMHRRKVERREAGELAARAAQRSTAHLQRPVRPRGARRASWREPARLGLREIPPYAGGVPYVEATDAQCHFPLWNDATPIRERMFCGADREDPGHRRNRYCARHARLCFVPPAARGADEPVGLRK